VHGLAYRIGQRQDNITDTQTDKACVCVGSLKS